MLHSNISGVEPLRYVDLPFYHLTCIICTSEEREAKVTRYESSSAGRETLGGWSVNNHYLPERFQRQPSTPTPPDDVLVSPTRSMPTLTLVSRLVVEGRR